MYKLKTSDYIISNTTVSLLNKIVLCVLVCLVDR